MVRPTNTGANTMPPGSGPAIVRTPDAERTTSRSSTPHATAPRADHVGWYASPDCGKIRDPSGVDSTIASAPGRSSTYAARVPFGAT